jgi:hypothetical protein
LCRIEYANLCVVPLRARMRVLTPRPHPARGRTRQALGLSPTEGCEEVGAVPPVGHKHAVAVADLQAQDGSSSVTRGSSAPPSEQTGTVLLRATVD